MKASLARVGALDRPIANEGLEYDYVFDEEQQINFVKATYAKQASEPPPPPRQSEAEKKAMTIAEVRKSLPVYEYREDLLAAIEQYPVIIIVGETGSGKV